MAGLEFLDDELANLERDGLLREARPPCSDGLLNLCSNDYLGYASQAFPGGASAGAGASRLVWGTHASHTRAEGAIASWTRHPAALLFSSGYAANVGLLQALAGPEDLIVSDALNHASIVDGCRLSRARVVVTPHLDVGAVEAALATAAARRKWVVTETYFSMDGDSPDLERLRGVCDEHGAGLVVDEAHAIGIFGPEGAGLCAAAGVAPEALVGTCGKALGAQGAFVAGSEALRTWLWNRARPFVFSTGVSPAVAELVAIRVVQVRGDDVARARLAANTAQLRRRLGAFDLGFSGGPILPIKLGSARSAVVAAEALRAEGILVQAIRPPTVPRGSSRLRMTVSATLTSAEVERSADSIVRALGRLLGEGGKAALSRVSRAMADVSHEEAARLGMGPAPAGTASLSSLGVRGGVVLVVGTGTGVGKTHVACALLRGLSARGFASLGLKPIESGAGEASDGQLLGRAVGLFHVKQFATFKAPLSPNVAARLEGRAVSVLEVAAWVRENCLSNGVTVVETAGGLFSPLNGTETNFELFRALRPDVLVLVGSDRLGVLHEVTACRRAGGGSMLSTVVVLSAAEAADLSTGSNGSELQQLLGLQCLTMPRCSPDSQAAALCLKPLLDRFT